MNNINTINNSYLTWEKPIVTSGKPIVTWEKPIDSSNVDINNINKLIDLLIQQYLNNPNQFKVNAKQPTSFNNLSQDELLKLLMLLLQYLNSINPNGNTFSPSDNSNLPGSFGNPQITIPFNITAPNTSNITAPNTRSDRAFIPPASNNIPSTSNTTPASTNSPSTSNTTPVNSSNKIDLSAYSPEEREKIQRFLDRTNDALNNPEKYRNPNNGKTASDG